MIIAGEPQCIGPGARNRCLTKLACRRAVGQAQVYEQWALGSHRKYLPPLRVYILVTVVRDCSTNQRDHADAE